MEEWRAVPGYEGFYEVSNMGRVKSVARQIEVAYKDRQGGVLPVRERILALHLTIHGYPFVILCRDGKKQRRVHQLVAAAFLPPKPEGGRYDVNHKNGVKTDNRPENLEWATPSENMRHKVDVLGKGRGETHGGSKLTAESVREIRRLISEGWGDREIAELFGVRHGNIFHIRRGTSWRSVA